MEKTTTQLSPELISNQLQHLLAQEEFKRSPILSKFLQYVVLTKLSGHEEEIKEYTIGIKALGRPVDFNPQLDAIVRIHASRLRTILFQYYHGAGRNDNITINMPKGTYVPVFEVRSETIKEAPTNGHSHAEINLPKTPVPFYKLDFVKPVLAVLSFHDLSPEESNINFLTSLGEQLSTELSRFDSLSVISFYATHKMGADQKDRTDLKSKGVDYILTGSLRFLNGTMRLNIQMMIAENGNILWSESFLRHELTGENLFNIQEEIISQVVNTIADDPKMIITLNNSRPGQNHQETSLVQRAISEFFDYAHDYDSRKFEPTLRAMEKAYETAPDNVLIVSILSKLYLDLYACAAEADTAVLEKGMELAKKAVSLDSRSQRAQKAMAWALVLSGNKEKAEEAIERCIAINPTAGSSLGTLGLGLIMLGEYEKGYSMLTSSLRFSYNAPACTRLGFSLYYYHDKNYPESGRWLNLLPPFDIPFSGLLDMAVSGKINGKIIQPGDDVLNIKGHENNIVDRIVLDPKLKREIVDGWKLAGFLPKGAN